MDLGSRGPDNLELVAGTNVLKGRGFHVRWAKGTGTDPINDADVIDTMEVDVHPASPGEDSYQITIDGLDPSTSYQVGVIALGSDNRADALRGRRVR